MYDNADDGKAKWSVYVGAKEQFCAMLSSNASCAEFSLGNLCIVISNVSGKQGYILHQVDSLSFVSIQ